MGILKKCLPNFFIRNGLEKKLHKFKSDKNADLSLIIFKLTHNFNKPVCYRAYFDYYGRALGLSIDGSPTHELYTSQQYSTNKDCLDVLTSHVGNASFIFMNTHFIFIDREEIKIFDRTQRDWVLYQNFDMTCRECKSQFKCEPTIIYYHKKIQCPNCSYASYLTTEQRHEHFLYSIV